LYINYFIAPKITRSFLVPNDSESVAERGFFAPVAKVRGASPTPVTTILSAQNKLKINTNLR